MVTQTSYSFAHSPILPVPPALPLKLRARNDGPSLSGPVSDDVATLAAQYAAVQRVIRAMHEQVQEPLALEEMAEIALFSPYHFARIFRQFTGVPPVQYLYALRLQVAKRLLLTTDLSVTDVCFAVGYNSLGTFSTRFTDLVGVTPGQLRRIGANLHTVGLQAASGEVPRANAAGPVFNGSVHAEWNGPIFVGLFSTPVPQGRPVRCALLREPGSFQISMPSDGTYYLLASSLGDASRAMYAEGEASELEDGALAAMLFDPTRLQVGASPGPLLVKGGRVAGSTTLGLRAVALTDPPLLTVLPVLLSLRMRAHERATAPQA